MDHLSPLDAAFLDAEDEDRHASLAIASIAVIEGAAPSQDSFIDAVRGRLPLVPRYRQKVRQLPLDLGQPVWVDDPRFDVGYHIRRTALPAPGDDAALCRLVARIMSQRLDRDRPLWECWVIEGLAGGRWAVLSKVHHCLADGISGNELYRILFDESAEPGAPVADDWRPEPEPSTVQLTLNALGDLVRSPVDQVRLLAHEFRTPMGLARRVRDISRGLIELAAVLFPVKDTSLTGPIGQPRRYGVARASLADVLRVTKAMNVTVNDVVLAAVSGAFRALLLRRGEEPSADAIRTLVPVSVRVRGADATLDNQISMMLPMLPIELADPLGRLTEVHRRLRLLKRSKEADAGEAMTTLAKHEPFAPISLAIRLAARLPHRHIVTVTTNVPGPRRTLYVQGQPIVEILPFVPIAVRLRTGISVLTYRDQMAFGVTCDYDNGPDADELATAIGDGIAELVRATQALPGAGAATTSVNGAGVAADSRSDRRGAARRSRTTATTPSRARKAGPRTAKQRPGPAEPGLKRT